jgi:NAD(P)-dependent dehydrogenase (short-subunit alcohol dehydrogenase family)
MTAVVSPDDQRHREDGHEMHPADSQSNRQEADDAGGREDDHAFETGASSFPYNVTKKAINGLTMAMALEFGPAIRVNTLNSCWVPTSDGPVDEATVAKYREIGNLHPVGRMGHPEDIAGAITFLASEDAAFITGTTLLADGGRGAVMYDRDDPGYLIEGWPEQYDLEWL